MQNNRLFADGAEFESEEGVRKQLVSYHSIDCDKDMLNRMSLDEILEFGEWEIVT